MNAFQYQIANFNNAKPPLLLHQPKKKKYRIGRVFQGLRDIATLYVCVFTKIAIHICVYVTVVGCGLRKTIL